MKTVIIIFEVAIFPCSIKTISRINQPYYFDILIPHMLADNNVHNPQVSYFDCKPLYWKKFQYY